MMPKKEYHENVICLCDFESVKKSTTIKPEHIVSVCLLLRWHNVIDDDSSNSIHNVTITTNANNNNKQEYMHDHK